MTPTQTQSEGSSSAPAGGAVETFASLFEASAGTRVDQLNEGDIVAGTVLKVGKDNVIVDIGYKSEGVIPIDEFKEGDEVLVKPGDTVDVLVESRENDDGLVILSKEKADRLKVWDEISAACDRDELIEGTITARVKGGLAVTIRGGVKAFLPGSQVDLRPIRNLDKLISQRFSFKVIKFNKKRGNIVLSRRVLLEQERDQLKARTLADLQEGQVVTGTIKNITEYGAFVDLGGIDGLLHITDMSWGRVNHPSEVFNVGDEVTVKVLKYNAETERVSLGLKQTTEDPWNNVGDSFPLGSKVSGKVVSLTDYGAFVEMHEGVEGLIHVSEMSWNKPKHPSKVVDVGDAVECIVLDIDAQNKRISLGLKQLEPDPWNAFVQGFNPGDIIRGSVRSITDYGVFIGIQDGVDGMVHKSDLSWTQRIENPAEIYHKGDEVEAIILSINHDDKKVSLGIKQLYEDPWSYIPERYPPGTVLEVRVTGTGEGGAFVEVERGIDGFVPPAEMSAEQAANPTEALKLGTVLKAIVVQLDPHQRHVTLSLKAAENREVEDESMRYSPDAAAAPAAPVTARRASAGSGATLGDVLKQKLGDLPADGGDAETKDEPSGEDAETKDEPSGEDA